MLKIINYNKNDINHIFAYTLLVMTYMSSVFKAYIMNFGFLITFRNMNSQAVCLKIKELRTNKGLTQLNLASLCDLDIRTIQRIEKGNYNMSLNVFFKIAENLQLDPCELIRG